jgi:hypothetical protein
MNPKLPSLLECMLLCTIEPGMTTVIEVRARLKARLGLDLGHQTAKYVSQLIAKGFVKAQCETPEQRAARTGAGPGRPRNVLSLSSHGRDAINRARIGLTPWISTPPIPSSRPAS